MNSYFYQNNIQSILVEGGTVTLKHFIEHNMWDEARVFTGTTNLFSGIVPPVFNFTPVQQLNIDGDALAIYKKPYAF
jgi:diaminohydroxyphosphoribosylaminopyrimidine deaminase/5-amino-6-(5-phosphoribosylamino)uracil reductase